MCRLTGDLDLGFCKYKFEDVPHIALIFDNDDERNLIITEYCKQIAQSNKCLIYFVDLISIQEFQANLEKIGLKFPNSRVLLNNALKGYCPDGFFNADEVLACLDEHIQSKIEEGYSYFQGSGEMSWALKILENSHELMLYETQLNIFIMKHPLIALCQYDTRLFNGETIMDVLKTHPYVIMKGKIFRNPYYMHLEEYIKTCSSHPLK